MRAVKALEDNTAETGKVIQGHFEVERGRERASGGQRGKGQKESPSNSGSFSFWAQSCRAVRRPTALVSEPNDEREPWVTPP